MPQAGRPSPQAGGYGSQPRGGVPRAGGPSAGGPAAGGPAAGRGQQPGQYQSPQQPYSPQPGGYDSPSGPAAGSSPRTDQWGAASPPRREAGPAPRAGEQRPQPEGSPLPMSQDQPFEEAAFADDREKDDWGAGGETTAIGRLGYMPKEPRRRSDFQKVRSRARKTSPWPKIGAAVVVLALIGGGTWWFLNSRDGDESEGAGEDANLTYSGSEEPCSLVDAGALESVVGGTEPVAAPETEQRSGSWMQTCTLTYGEPEQSTALLQIDGGVYDSDSKAAVNYELGTGDISEMVEPWTLVDPAPAIGDQSAAVARIPDEPGTSNYQLHLQDANVYLVVRLSVSKDTPMDQQALTDLTTELANAYLENWRDAS